MKLLSGCPIYIVYCILNNKLCTSTFCFRDRLRTTANVMSNLFGTILIHKVCKGSLPAEETPNDDVTLELNHVTETNDARL